MGSYVCIILSVQLLSNPTPTGAKILDALLRIVGECGFDHATVREVAAASGVSIGTVQHHFPSKDTMMAAAFAEVVRRITNRVEARVAASDDVRRNLRAVLAELLPLDDRRATEARIQIAFAARAATEPLLAAQQREVLNTVHDALSAAFALAGGQNAGSAATRRAAHVALAVTDGLALHAVSSNGLLSAEDLLSALGVVLDGQLARLDPP